MAPAGLPPAPCRRLIFLNRYFHPDHSATSQMLSDLAFALARQNREVIVITSRQRYDAPAERLAAFETISGVTVRRVWTTRFGRTNLIGRAIDYATFYLTSAGALLALVRRGDAVIVMTDPPLLSVAAAPVARVRGALLVNWLQDIFPEVATASGIGTSGASGLGARCLAWLRDKTLKGAAANVVLGERMAARMRERGVGSRLVCIIPNWADGAAITPIPPADNGLRTAWGLDQAFVAGYSGNLGRVHEFGTFADAIENLEQRGDTGIVWLFIGGGSGLAGLQLEVARRGLKSVQFRPYQPREQLSLSLSAADVHLVSLRGALEGYVVPSKYYGIAAAGRPAIFVGAEDGEIAHILAQTGAGVWVAENDGAGLADAIATLAANRARAEAMGHAARTAFDRSFSFELAVRRWSDLLDGLGRP